MLRRALFDRDALRRELREEHDLHMELDAMQRRHAGDSADEARRAARARFGRPERVRERLVDATGVSALESVAHDLRLAARTLRAHPGFTLVAVLTLALGVGANTLVFSAVRGMLVRPLPLPDADRLV